MSWCGPTTRQPRRRVPEPCSTSSQTSSPTTNERADQGESPSQQQRSELSPGATTRTRRMERFATARWCRRSAGTTRSTSRTSSRAARASSTTPLGLEARTRKAKSARGFASFGPRRVGTTPAWWTRGTYGRGNTWSSTTTGTWSAWISRGRRGSARTTPARMTRTNRRPIRVRFGRRRRRGGDGNGRRTCPGFPPTRRRSWSERRRWCPCRIPPTVSPTNTTRQRRATPAAKDRTTRRVSSFTSRCGARRTGRTRRRARPAHPPRPRCLRATSPRSDPASHPWTIGSALWTKPAENNRSTTTRSPEKALPRALTRYKRGSPTSSPPAPSSSPSSGTWRATTTHRRRSRACLSA
mmetsp:Transcript_7510/g.33955  ORF Transcript_7510/g.33955 Transcript_7510/m.33955 type:complete len:354 (-) Transcript_7510:862-1923(-)